MDLENRILNKESLSWMKKGAWIVNTARGALAVKEDVAAALESGHIAGYAGDVWEVQPAPVDHPWRKMKRFANSFQVTIL